MSSIGISCTHERHAYEIIFEIHVLLCTQAEAQAHRELPQYNVAQTFFGLNGIVIILYFTQDQ